MISLGEQYLQGSFVKPEKENPPLRRIECTLVRCNPIRDENACGLLQMAHSVPPEILYSAYWYRSGTNNTMRNHLQDIAVFARQLMKPASCTVLDIGCNDGTLLGFYPEADRKFGIDPSDIAANLPANIKVVSDLFPSEELEHQLDGARCDIITSIAMFYDLEDPVAFARAISRILAPEGIWIIEMSYMPLMLEMNSYDTICHEHLEYYSLAVIERIMREANLKVVRAELNTINGGSLRCTITHEKNFSLKNDEWQRELRALRQKEFDLKLDTDEPYRYFQDRINIHRDKLLKLLTELKRAGKTIHIYGASTKGNTILQWCGIDGRLVDMAAERNPDKVGARTLGTDIPIVSEEHSRALRPDYYLVLPWHFADEFVQREKALLEAGTKMIFPLPDIKIVGSEDLPPRGSAD